MIDAYLRSVEAALTAVKNLKQHYPEELLTEISGYEHSTYLFSGAGKCAYVARKLAATMRSYGFNAHFLHPSDAMHGDMGLVDKESFVMFISLSGETEEICELARTVESKYPGVSTVAMTGNVESTLASHCLHKLPITIKNEGEPNGLAPMASTTAMMVAGDAMISSLIQDEKLKKKHFSENHPGGTLGKKLFYKVSAIMRKDMPIVGPTAPMTRVLYHMCEGRQGSVFITDAKNKPLGIITDGDITRSLFEDMDSFLMGFAKDHMTLDPRIICQGTMAIDALKIMEQEPKVTILPVVDSYANGKLVGAIHIHDLVKAGLK